MTHPLRAYLTEKHITVAALTKAIARRGVKTSANYISQIIGGHRQPGGSLACALSAATNGAVPVEALLMYRREPKRRKRAA